MTTIFKAYLASFICTLMDIFEMFDMNIDYLEDRDFSEDMYLADIEGAEAMLFEAHGIEYLNEFSEGAATNFNSWYYGGDEFCEVYNGLSAEKQESVFFSLIFYLMQYITHKSPAEFAECIQNSLKSEDSDAYKALMLLKALEDAKEYIECA